MTRSLLSSVVVLALAAIPANAGSILDAMEPPADALRVEFVSPDTSPADRLKAGQPLTVDVAVTRQTGALQIMPTSTPDWMTYDAANRQFSGGPVPGEHELSVRVVDVGTGQTATGILSFNVKAR